MPFTATEGKWRFYSPYPPQLCAIGPKYIWMAGYAQIVQIDSATGKVRIFTPLDGLPLEHGVQLLTVSPDDRALLVLQNYPNALLWSEKDGWKALPPLPEGGEIHRVSMYVEGQPIDSPKFVPFADACFDLDGTILALPRDDTPLKDSNGKIIRTFSPGSVGTELLEYSNGQWKPRRKIPHSEQVIPMKDGLALRLGWVQPAPGKPSACDVVLLKPDDADASHMAKIGVAHANQHQSTSWIGGRLIEFRGYNPYDAPNHLGLPRARELTATGYKDLVKLESFGIDLKSEAVAKVEAKCVPGPGTNIYAQTFQFNRFGDLSLGFRTKCLSDCTAIRDKAGNFWVGMCCWDGQRLTNYGTKLPPMEALYREADPRWFDLDSSEGFVLNQPDEALKVGNYNPVTRQGWSFSNGLQLVELDKQGKSKVLGNLDRKNTPLDSMLPQFQGSDGAWWCGLLGKGAVRVTPEMRVKQYDVKGVGFVSFRNSPKGNLFLVSNRESYSSVGQTFYKYQPATDTFESCTDAWDDFSFKIGPYELAAMPTSYGSEGAVVMRKINGKWQRFRLPFCSALPVLCSGSVRGERMLLSFPFFGVMEYDGKTNRWACLTDNFCHPVLDGKGRRILILPKYALIYEGDPFDSPLLPFAKPAAEDEKLFQTLLKQLDADDPKQRDKASELLKKMAPRVPGLVQLAADDEKLSLEARERMGEVFKTLPPEALPGGNAPALIHLDCSPTAPPATQPASQPTSGLGEQRGAFAHRTFCDSGLYLPGEPVKMLRSLDAACGRSEELRNAQKRKNQVQAQEGDG